MLVSIFKSNIYYFNLLSVLYTDSKRPACAHDAGKGFRARQKPRCDVFANEDFSYRSGREDATTATYATSGAKAEAIPASLLRKSSSFMVVSLSGLSIDPQKRVLLGPEGKRDELVGDRREARKRQCAVYELLDDHGREERRAAES